MMFTLYKTGQRSTGRLDVTDIGRSTFMALILVLIATLFIPAFGVFATLLSLEAIALLVGVFYRPRIQMEASLPPRIIVDQITYLHVTLRNTSHWPAYQMSVLLDGEQSNLEQLDPIPYIERLRPGQVINATLKVRPRQRGTTTLKRPLCSSIFPFNLFRFNTARADLREVTILPAHGRTNLPMQAPAHVSPMGQYTTSPLQGLSPEYIGSRPFTTGDSPRLIDSRAWARLARPAVKEFQEDMQSDVGLILDNGHPDPKRMSPFETECFEAAVSLCATLAVSLEQGRQIEMLCLGPKLHRFSGQTDTLRLERTLQLLADCHLESPINEATLLDLVDSFGRLSAFLLILRQWHPHWTEIMKCAHQARCRLSLWWIGSAPEPAIQETWQWADRVQILSPEQVRQQWGASR